MCWLVIENWRWPKHWKFQYSSLWYKEGVIFIKREFMIKEVPSLVVLQVTSPQVSWDFLYCAKEYWTYRNKSSFVLTFFVFLWIINIEMTEDIMLAKYVLGVPLFKTCRWEMFVSPVLKLTLGSSKDKKMAVSKSQQRWSWQLLQETQLFHCFSWLSAIIEWIRDLTLSQECLQLWRASSYLNV